MTDTAAPTNKAFEEAKGKRRPTPADLEPILASVALNSLNATCKEMGLDTPSTWTWLHDDKDRRQKYIAACAMRAQSFIEDGLLIGRAAALGLTVGQGADARKVDANGARVYITALQWAEGRMAPKTVETKHLHHTFGALDDDALDAEIKRAEREAAGLSEGDDG